DSRCLAIVASDFLPHDDVLLRFKELCLRLVKLLIGCCPYTLKLLLPLGSVGKMSYHHFNCGLWFYLSEAPGMIHPLGISDRSMAGGLILVSCLQSVVCLQHFQLRHNGSPHHQPSRLNTRWRISKRYLMKMPQEFRIPIEGGDF